MEKSDLEAVADVLRGTNIAVISDEIYGELTYEGVHTSIALLDGMRERTIVVGGFSKSHAMTGWRLSARAVRIDCADVQNPPVRHYVRAYNQPVCRC